MTSNELALLEAIEEEKYEVVQDLVRTCINVNFTSEIQGWTPLFIAIRNSHIHRTDSQRPWSDCKMHRKMVELLLEAGANPDLPNNNAIASTPLSVASWVGCKKAMKALIKASANPNLADKSGRTPLHLASNRCFDDEIKLLVDAGADPNLTDNLGQTPLVDALKNGHAKAAKILLDAGADPTMAANNGDTPSSLAYAKDFFGGKNYVPSAAVVSVRAMLACYPQLTTLRTLCARVIRKHRVDHQFVPQIVFRQPNEVEEEREYRKRKRAFKENRSNKKR